MDIDILVCSCCDRSVPDTPRDNVDFGVVPNPHDEGYGMCRACGGDPARNELGWAGRTFYEARFDVLRDRLNPDNVARFEALSYHRKCWAVAKLIERGVMI